jgi:hypothetical protein
MRLGLLAPLVRRYWTRHDIVTVSAYLPAFLKGAAAGTEP